MFLQIVHLPQSIAGANEFMDAAETFCDITYDYLEGPITNEAVTNTALTTDPQREYADFIYFDGHGLRGQLYTGDDPGYGLVNVSSLSMGGDYIRWASFYTCLTLIDPDSVANFWQNWDAAFNGVKVVLGFSSLTWAISTKEEIHNQFWEDWVDNDVYIRYLHQKLIKMIIFH